MRESEQRYLSGYNDAVREIADQVRDAHHVRYIKTPSGRTLYLVGSREGDADEIAEIKFITAAANAALLVKKVRP